MSLTLDPTEARVLGCLAEKELATPEYYPLTLNALTNACNQKSNRDPVMSLDEAQVQAALDSLRKKQLAMVSSEGVRTSRFAHNLRGVLHLDVDEIALMCELLLRGPQTVGELRTRADRMHPFTDLATVEAALQELADRTPPLVTQLPRQPGRKESRYSELLSEPGDESEVTTFGGDTSADGSSLGDEVAQLRAELENLRSDFEAFRRQFE